MSSFWLTKKIILEALKMSEGMPQNTFITFEGKSEVVNGTEFTFTTIYVGGKKKTIKQNFDKIKLDNGEV
jgi:hypothetical protein